jgi:phosphotransferase system  glucose/maltose/N-acetylglucosamine-specific IIC component
LHPSIPFWFTSAALSVAIGLITETKTCVRRTCWATCRTLAVEVLKWAGLPTRGRGLLHERFCPVRMFGLPEACLALYRAALPEGRAEIDGVLLSGGLSTGVTKPAEFRFMLLSSLLTGYHRGEQRRSFAA